MSGDCEIRFACPESTPGKEDLRRLRRHRRAFSALSTGSFLDLCPVLHPSGRAPGPLFHVEWTGDPEPPLPWPYWRYWEKDA